MLFEGDVAIAFVMIWDQELARGHTEPILEGCTQKTAAHKALTLER
jgi:hypothetical protein